MRKIKVKPIPVKEARALVEKQRLEINRLSNEISSLEGARVNLRTMYEHGLKLTEQATNAQKEMALILKQSYEVHTAIKVKNVKLEAVIAVYRAETPGQIIRRGIKIFFRQRVDAIKNFFGRLSFRKIKR